jgi:hypothetical protein
MPRFLDWIRANTSRPVRRAVVGTVGGSVVLAGVAMLVLPGPGVAAILLGFGILALEFEIARQWVVALRERVERGAARARVPRSVLWILPAMGIGLTVAVGVVPAMYAVVHGGGTWEVVRKPTFGWEWSWATYDGLRGAAVSDPEAAGILARCRQRPAS